MTSYVILFCISPYLNRACKSMSKERFQSLLGILCFIFVIIPTFFYVDILNDHGKNIVNMALVYLIGQYVHSYGLPLWIRKYNIIILSVCIGCIFVFNAVISFFKGYFFLWFAHDNSFFILLSSICIFLLFSKWNYKSMLINRLAQYVFPLYLTQHLLTVVFRPWCETHNNSFAFILYLSLVVCLIWGVTLLVEMIRKSVFDSAINKITRRIELFTNQLIRSRLLDRKSYS